jgi:hypothetical protein
MTNQDPSEDVDAPQSELEWSVVVFARNSADVLLPCLEGLAVAAAGRRARITVLLNGNTDNSADVVRRFARDASIEVDVQEIPFGDKSNAWNQFIHGCRPEAQTYFFVDSYAVPTAGALAALDRALQNAPGANAAAAVPSSGRSAAATRANMMRTPALHGSLFALRGRFVRRLWVSGLRLPAGLYRGDGLIGSFVVNDLDGRKFAWNLEHISVAPDATWTVTPVSKLRRPQQIWNRLVRQARGLMEDQAIKERTYHIGFEQLPRFADAMIADWIAADPATRRPSWRRNPLGWLAARKLQPHREPDEQALAARRLFFVPSDKKVGSAHSDNWAAPHDLYEVAS